MAFPLDSKTIRPGRVVRQSVSASNGLSRPVFNFYLDNDTCKEQINCLLHLFHMWMFLLLQMPLHPYCRWCSNCSHYYGSGSPSFYNFNSELLNHDGMWPMLWETNIFVVLFFTTWTYFQIIILLLFQKSKMKIPIILHLWSCHKWGASYQHRVILH